MATYRTVMLTSLLSCVVCSSGAYSSPELTLLTLAEYVHGEVDLDAANNPDNMLFQLPSDQYRLELRPTLHMDWRPLELSLDPRLAISRRDIEAGGVEEETDILIRYWQADWQYSNAYLTGGRYVQLWGPSVVLSPTSRYHADNGSVSPTRELSARDFVEVGYYLSSEWELQVVANVGEGEQELDDFERNGDIRLRWVGESINVTAQASWLHPSWAWGLIAQWTVNDALIAYADGLYGADAGVAQSVLANSVCEPNSPADGPQAKATICDEVRRSNDHMSDQSALERRLKAVAGMSYTLQNGINLSLDYYYNEAGLSREESQLLLNEAVNSTSRILSGATGTNDRNIARGVSDLPFFDLSKHYLMGRITQQHFFKELDGTAIYSRNLDDESSQATLNLECHCFDTLAFYLSANWYSGDLDTEYGRFYDRLWKVGIKWFY